MTSRYRAAHSKSLTPRRRRIHQIIFGFALIMACVVSCDAFHPAMFEPKPRQPTAYRVTGASITVPIPASPRSYALTKVRKRPEPAAIAAAAAKTPASVDPVAYAFLPNATPNNAGAPAAARTGATANPAPPPAPTGVNDVSPNGLLSGPTEQGPAAVNTFAAVPEPSTWIMLIAGFGSIGCALRRRRALHPLTN